jgi:hypothetical protein
LAASLLKSLAASISVVVAKSSSPMEQTSGCDENFSGQAFRPYFKYIYAQITAGESFSLQNLCKKRTAKLPPETDSISSANSSNFSKDPKILQNPKSR